MALTDTWLKANAGKAREQIEVKTDRGGLSVRVSPLGKIVYQMRYRYDGKAKRLDLGSYPHVSLKAARDEHARLKAKLEQGHDPKVVVAVEKQKIVSALTLEDLFERWYKGYCVVTKKAPELIQRTFQIHVLPRLGKLPAHQITIHEWLDLLEGLVDHSEAIAARVLVNTKQMYKWAIRRELVSDNPLANIVGATDLNIKKRTSTRTLADADIALVWEAIDRSRMSPKNKVFVKLCLVYGCRSGEMRLAKKAHFDFDAQVWLIPPENHKIGTKTGKALKRPIFPGAQGLLEEAFALSAKGAHLFNNAGSDEPMSRGVPLQLPYNLMQWLRRHKGVEMAHWSMHDLRRTARTNFSTLAPPHIAETMLGHKMPGEWQTYDLHDYLGEQRDAYDKWWERLTGIVGQAA
ncbi:integrase [Pseudohongiella acticola]|uniref:Integrase n=1 Tax=Pseudohongiella acticola TaxID=1524254 RepID=A0A1E8CIM5_9GAMM|nr:site-specific integrase [Pseudohongiella acticola]OFE12350.1 integrase [Pseudohongiella acticola]